jgi:hypothetical protein
MHLFNSLTAQKYVCGTVTQNTDTSVELSNNTTDTDISLRYTTVVYVYFDTLNIYVTNNLNRYTN